MVGFWLLTKDVHDVAESFLFSLFEISGIRFMLFDSSSQSP